MTRSQKRECRQAWQMARKGYLRHPGRMRLDSVGVAHLPEAAFREMCRDGSMPLYPSLGDVLDVLHALGLPVNESLKSVFAQPTGYFSV